MHISLARVLDAARERRATLTPEVAGYVILLAARQLGAEASCVSASSVILDDAGDVRVERGAAASPIDIDASLRGLLAASIALCSSPPPAIVAVAERSASGDLSALAAELSAALIPINHSAAHRALARLCREARRADGPLQALSTPPSVDPGSEPEADDELDIDVVIEPAGVAGSADPWSRPRSAPERSDLHRLLQAYLPDAGSPQSMLRALRDMIALKVKDWPA